MMISLALALVAPPVAAAPVSPVSEVPVRIWMKKRQYEAGDAIKVQVETGRGGYLLVLHLTPTGALEVLFPVFPGDDSHVQPDRRYELRPPGQAASFVAVDGGLGLIYSALAEDPFDFGAFVDGGAWNASALRVSRDSEDPEADLTAMVQRMSSPRGFDYDVQEYAVIGEVLVEEGVTPPAWWSPTYVYVEGYGGPGCFSCGYITPAGITVGVGFGWSWGYSPYWWGWPYGYWGYGYWGPGYGYYPGWGYPYYPTYRPPYYPGGGHVVNGPRVVGRPRGYEVRPPVRPEPGDPRNVVRGGEGSGAGRDGMGPARRARPNGGEARPRAGGRPSGGGAAPATGGSTAKPGNGGSQPAPRARPRGGDRPPDAARIATQPNVERGRPETGRPEWIRIDDAATPRRVEAGTAGRPTQVTRVVRAGQQDGRISQAPPARRTRSGGISKSFSQARAKAEARAASSGSYRGGGSVGRPASRGGSGAVSRGSSQPRSVPRAAPAGGTGRGVSAPSGGGGGRARGRPGGV